MSTRSNPILKIPNHSDFKIPIHFSDDALSSYFSQLKAHFSTIDKFLSRCNEKHFSPSIKENIVERVKEIQTSIIEVLNQYLNGHPSKAYSLFKEMLDKYEIKSEINSLQQHKVPKNSLLYRTQKEYSSVNKGIKNKQGFLKFRQPTDVFHPPFQRRRSVSTNRFSISGYPCLYLSENLITSYSECFPDSKISEPFNAVCLKNVRPLYFLDLSDDNLSGNPLLFEGLLPELGKKGQDVSSILSSLGIYQLVLASHTKIDYRPIFNGETYFFKAEYIIPQLLLQWLKLEGFALDGIRYKSCTGNRRFPNNSNHYNYVLPVQDSLEKGFCPSLTAVFLSTKVYSCLDNITPTKAKKTLNQISKELASSPFDCIC